jgi:hypothetical protein
MGRAGTYYVYILASGRHGTLYIGVTNNLGIRLEQRRGGRGSEFVKKYAAVVGWAKRERAHQSIFEFEISGDLVGTAQRAPLPTLQSNAGLCRDDQ